MTDYAVTLAKRDGHKRTSKILEKLIKQNYQLYEGKEGNNNYYVVFWLGKGETAAANNDTITITLG